MYRSMKLEGRATEASYDRLINYSGHSALQVAGDPGILGSELVQKVQQAMTVMRQVKECTRKKGGI